jgi:hypothetical protein
MQRYERYNEQFIKVLLGVPGGMATSEQAIKQAIEYSFSLGKEKAYSFDFLQNPLPKGIKRDYAEVLVSRELERLSNNPCSEITGYTLVDMWKVYANVKAHLKPETAKKLMLICGQNLLPGKDLILEEENRKATRISWMAYDELRKLNIKRPNKNFRVLVHEIGRNRKRLEEHIEDDEYHEKRYHSVIDGFNRSGLGYSDFEFIRDYLQDGLTPKKTELEKHPCSHCRKLVRARMSLLGKAGEMLDLEARSR